RSSDLSIWSCVRRSRIASKSVDGSEQEVGAGLEALARPHAARRTFCSRFVRKQFRAHFRLQIPEPTGLNSDFYGIEVQPAGNNIFGEQTRLSCEERRVSRLFALTREYWRSHAGRQIRRRRSPGAATGCSETLSESRASPAQDRRSGRVPLGSARHGGRSRIQTAVHARA